MKLLAFCLLARPEQYRQITRAGAWMEENARGSLLVREVQSWVQLGERTVAGRPDVFVLDPHAGMDCFGHNQVLREIIRLASRSPIVAYPSQREFPVEAWMQLFDHGVRSVIEPPQDRLPWAIADRLLNAYALSRANKAIDALGDREDLHRWLDLLRKALPHAHRGLEDELEPSLSVSRMADLWIRGSKGHHLQDALRKEGLPPAGWLARWLLALRCLSARPVHRTWEAVALSVGFETYRDLSRFIRRFSGYAPTELQVETLVHLFRARMRTEANECSAKAGIPLQEAPE